MSDKNKFTVVRLNSLTFPPNDDERNILATANAKMLEIEGANDEEISSSAKDADAIMIVSSYLRNPVIRQLKKCRIISRMGTGVDKIDVEQATRQGIIVTNLPDFCTDEVGDHTVALLLSVARQLKESDIQMRKGKKHGDIVNTHRLSVQSVGLVGFGRIGRAVAKRCRSFGMKVLSFDPALTTEMAEKEDVTTVPLDRLLKESDYVCLLCPLLPSTRKMISMKQLVKMKKSAVLVNTGRGELVNEADLVKALKEGIIRFAALDVFAGINVFAPDGFPTDHPFFSLDNVLLTPHVAALSQESLSDSRLRGAQAVADVLGGQWPRHPVNPEVQPWFSIGNQE